MLHYAANAGNLDMVTVLLAHAASPDVQSTGNCVPLLGSLPFEVRCINTHGSVRHRWALSVAPGQLCWA